MSRWVEMAIGSPSRRVTLVPYDEMWDIVYESGSNQAIYRSVYIYDEEGLDFVQKNKTVKSFLCVGKGIGPVTTAPVLLTVLTIFSAELSTKL